MLEVRGLSKTFGSGGMFRHGGDKKAVDDVGFRLEAGETLAIVGESGSGKSTTARLAMRLIEPDAGEILWAGEAVHSLSAGQLRKRRHHIQMVFQDPFASLNPRMRIWESVAEGLRVHQPSLDRARRRDRVAEVLGQCGLDDSGLDRYPHQFSGGQRQRIGIARALIVEPKVLVLDEPVSALDVSVQAQILNLLKDIQQQRRLSYLFISHDLSVVRHIADRVSVMFAGRVVEEGSIAEVFEQPRHPYTAALLEARPIAHPSERQKAAAEAATLEDVAKSGCAYRLRCPNAGEDCRDFDGVLSGDKHRFACLHPVSGNPTAEPDRA
ncbi:MAG TPA: ABC transporter ATP-binding protein [Mariprofundaceae bacterium]|nr:ABC transporter ATP-binding protein [Mariprofundaceae bacterium]